MQSISVKSQFNNGSQHIKYDTISKVGIARGNQKSKEPIKIIEKIKCVYLKLGLATW